MKYIQLREKAKDYPIFHYLDILKWFPKDNEETVKQNLKYWVKQGWITRLYRGVYQLSEVSADEFVLASNLNLNSYISLESALNAYGIIPDVPFAVTSVTIKKTQTIATSHGRFIYRKIKSELFWGFKIVGQGNFLYKIAKPEKAFLDYLYLNSNELSLSFLEESRFSFPKDFSWRDFFRYVSYLKDKKITAFSNLLKSYDHQ